MAVQTNLHEPDSVSDRSRFAMRFGDRRRVFLPVIYVAEEEQTLNNVEIARVAQADGVFLVNHGIGHQRLLRIAAKVLEAQPDLCIGVNCLDLRPQDVICRLPEGVEAVWANNPPSISAVRDKASAVREARQLTGWNGMFFGDLAVGLKVEEGLTAAELAGATAHIDVLTIVGQDPKRRDLPVLQQLSQLADGLPLGIAGDVQPDVVTALLPYARCILTTPQANSGLEHMDLEEATQLAEMIHAFQGDSAAAGP